MILINKSTLLFKLIQFFVWVLLFEVMVGGAGRLFEFNGFTLRMVFFIIAFLIQILLYFKASVKTKKIFLFFEIAFFLLTCLGLIIGFIENNNRDNIIENIKYSLFFIILPFLSYFIKSTNDVKHICNMFKLASIVIALIYLSFLVFVFTGYIKFSDLEILSNNTEFALRGNTAFFYKGFIFMCVGFFFLVNSSNKISAFIVILPAIILTFTRGFLISLILTYILYYLFKKKTYSILIITLSILLFSYAKGFYEDNLGDKSESDQIRIEQFNEVYSKTNFVNIIFGHGLGSGTTIRDNHFEITYLEIFYKQGLLGLLFWLSILAFILYYYYKSYLIGNEKYALPFLLSTLFLYIQSFTNPFLINSLGITILMLSMISLNVLSNKLVVND